MATNIDLQAPVKDLQIEQGASVTIPFAVKRGSTPFAMTGYDLRLQVRKTHSDSTVLINCTLQNEKLTWTNQAEGKFELRLKPEDTNQANGKIRFANGVDELDCVYDIEFVSPTSTVYKGCKGAFVIYREVTR